MAHLLCVGVDVALKQNRARFLDDTETDRGRLAFPNDAGGAVSLAAQTCRLLTRHQIPRVRFALEATSFYGWHLALYLTKAPELEPFAPEVYLFNARTIDAYKKTYPDLPKTDWVDAYVLADRVRIGRLPRPFAYDDRYLPLQRLTRHRYFLVKQLVRHKNYFLGYLFLKCSRLAQACPISDPLGAAGRELILAYPSAEDLAAAPLDELARFLVDKSRNKFYNPYDVAKALQAAAKHSYRLPERLKDPVNRILASTLQIIRDLEREVRQTSRAIEREMHGVPCPLLSIPGIGPVFGAGILAEIGDVFNFPDDDALAKFAGLTWREHASGAFEGEDKPLSRTGNPYLRYYLVEAANSVRRYAPEYQAYYERKFREATRHHHKRALVLTARKLVRLVYALLRTGRAYTGTRKEACPA